MRGEHRPTPPRAAPSPDEGSELRGCVNILGLNRAASQELFWPSHVGRCEGPPQSYVHMPFGFLNRAAMHQHHMQGVLAAHEARHQATLEEMEEHPQEPPGRSGPLEARHQGGS